MVNHITHAIMSMVLVITIVMPAISMQYEPIPQSVKAGSSGAMSGLEYGLVVFFMHLFLGS